MSPEELVKRIIQRLNRWSMEETGQGYSPTDQEIQLRLAIDENLSLSVREISEIRTGRVENGV